MQVKRAAELGISGQYAASLVYAFGIAQAVGRTLGGVAVDHVPFNSIAMCTGIMIICGVAIDVSIFITSYIGKNASHFIQICSNL